jgi:hypothetical protein
LQLHSSLAPKRDTRVGSPSESFSAGIFASKRRRSGVSTGTEAGGWVTSRSIEHFTSVLLIPEESLDFLFEV